MKLIPKHTSGSPIKALKLFPKDVRNLNKATSVEGYGDKVITDEYGNFIPASEIYKYGIVNSSGNMEGFIPEILVSPKYSITKEHLLSRTRVNRIFLMLLFIISTVNINYAQHMKFNGISMGETPTVFINKLKAKGFTPIYQNSDNILMGEFCGIESCTVVVTINRNMVLGTTSNISTK